MSSEYVRTQIKSFIQANAPTEYARMIDLTAAYQEVKELVAAHGIAEDTPWMGIQFIAGDEIPVGLAATNDQGKYREDGAIFFHFVDVAKLGLGDILLTRGEAMRDLFRGRRIGDIIIESVTPMNFDSGATLQFEGGYMSGSFFVSFIRDRDL